MCWVGFMPFAISVCDDENICLEWFLGLNFLFSLSFSLSHSCYRISISRLKTQQEKRNTDKNTQREWKRRYPCIPFSHESNLLTYEKETFTISHLFLSYRSHCFEFLCMNHHISIIIMVVVAQMHLC